MPPTQGKSKAGVREEVARQVEVLLSPMLPGPTSVGFGAEVCSKLTDHYAWSTPPFWAHSVEGLWLPQIPGLLQGGLH
jgi:hypothetical protein